MFRHGIGAPVEIRRNASRVDDAPPPNLQQVRHRQLAHDERRPREPRVVRRTQRHRFGPCGGWSSGLDGQAGLLPSYTAETAAIHTGDADAARDACVGRAEVMGRLMLAELVRRRVLEPVLSDRGNAAVFGTGGP